jgi:outer membrane protein OmpA-like peptidoglycan-associated protein
MRYRPCLFALLVFVQSITLTVRAQSHDTLARLSGAAADSSEYLQLFSAPAFADTLVLHFDFDRYTLRSKETARLDSLCQGPSFTAGHPFSLSIDGYTDAVGTKAYNQRLASHRAEAALAYIKKSKLYWKIHNTTIIQHGEDDSINGVDSLDRRVVVILWYSPKGPSSPYTARTMKKPVAAATIQSRLARDRWL